MNDSISMEKLREIYDAAGGDTQEVARRLNLTHDEIILRTTDHPTFRRRRQPPADLGKPSMRKHIIATRHADNPIWSNQDQVDRARKLYEAGTHTMCQGRDRDWFVLYLIPLKKPGGPRQFFRTFF